MGIAQYQNVLVNLEPIIGSEIKKTRPCVIVSPDEMNRHLGTIIIAPMTTRSSPYPTRVRVKQKNESGWVVIDQLRTIDKQRIIKVLGVLSPAEINKIKRVIREMLVD
jgi:mRNA interferase MazF